jgi:hypothetical protein
VQPARHPPGADRATSGAALALADAAGLLVFVAVGLRSHRIGAMGETFLRNAVPLAVAWITVSLVLHTYRRRDLVSLFATWAISVPAALLARSWWVGSPREDRLLVFVAVGLGFTLLFVLAARAATALLTRSRLVWRRSDPDQ